jgi:nucleotide-binding universal stress UspA family protein
MVKPVCLKNILVADDGSVHARAAIQLLLKLSLTPDTHTTILRVFGSQQATELFQLEAAGKENCARLRDRGLSADPELLLGSPAEKIIEFAEQHHNDLIVLGARGLRATLGILLGGVAQQVIEYAPCPVLVVRAPFKRLRRILLVVDGSSNSQHAAECMLQFPFPDPVDLRIMHVLPPPLAASGTKGRENGQGGPASASEEQALRLAEEEAEGQHLLERIGAIMAAGQIKVETILKRGDAATEIISYAKRNRIDLIAAGSRGLSRVRSWLLGSVSRKLVHYSGCSVLIVRTPG